MRRQSTKHRNGVNCLPIVFVSRTCLLLPVPTKREVVTLENGCICCTLRADLIREIHRIQTEALFDYVLSEATGVAEPQS